MVRTTGPAPSFMTSDNGEPVYRPGLDEDEDAPREMRVEHDSLGEMPIPADAYWGIHTARALTNFPITRRALSNHPNLVIALAMVKQAAARANKELGVLRPERADLIDQVCQEIIEGELHDQFVLGVLQGGAGTSTNMCANEIIANRCLELMGLPKGDYDSFHPIDHVNRSQSTNDVYPTAIKLAMVFSLRSLLDEHRLLIESFTAKGQEFASILKVGRTQLQDAVPMTLGQEFRGFATTLGEDQERLGEIIPWLNEINMGATAIGTGITADPRYAESVRRHLSEISGYTMVTAPDLIEATSDTGVFMTVSGTLKRAAVKLSKICNDLRLLSSGPQAGFGEISLPAEGGQLQLNAFEPVIASSILQSLAWMTNACRTLRLNCVDGITANEARLASMVESSVGVVTALTPYIGYQRSAALAYEALSSDVPVRQLVIERGLMTEAEIAKVLSPERLSGVVPPTGAIALPMVPPED